MTFDELYKYIINKFFKDRPIPGDLYSTTLTFGHIDSYDLVHFMNRGEEELATKTHCIEDSDTYNLSIINLCGGYNGQFDLHESIIEIKAAWLESTEGVFIKYLSEFKGWGPFTLVGTNSLPTCFKVSYSTKKLNLDSNYSTSSVNLRLTVARTPKEKYELPLTTDATDIYNNKLNRESEIPSFKQMDLAFYVGTRVLAERSMDGSSNRDFKTCKDEWQNTITELKRLYYNRQAGSSHYYTQGIR